MKTSQCQCGNKLFFENTLCQICRSEVGFLADVGFLSPLVAIDASHWQSTVNHGIYRKCQNYVNNTGCNWMVAESDSHTFCLSCRLSEIIPNLSKPGNIERWNEIELAKRRLIYSLFWLGLPLIDKNIDPVNGLSFQLTEDNEHYSEFATNPWEAGPVMTGHIDGTISLNIAEADPVFREKIRTRLQERYRTLLGHLRHESGHYYWDRLVKNSNLLQEFRTLFGDEQGDYQSSLQDYYNRGPIDNWQSNWVSAYASSHPWEDWAECWAHYLHIVDTLETAYDFGGTVYTSNFVIQGQQFSKQYLSSVSINQLLDEWSKLSVMLNEMNRSLGLADAYPFYMSGILIDKMAFIHKVILSS